MYSRVGNRHWIGDRHPRPVPSPWDAAVPANPRPAREPHCTTMDLANLLFASSDSLTTLDASAAPMKKRVPIAAAAGIVIVALTVVAVFATSDGTFTVTNVSSAMTLSVEKWRRSTDAAAVAPPSLRTVIAATTAVPRTAEAGATIDEMRRSGPTVSGHAVALFRSLPSGVTCRSSASAMMKSSPGAVATGIVTATAADADAPAASAGTLIFGSSAVSPSNVLFTDR